MVCIKDIYSKKEEEEGQMDSPFNVPAMLPPGAVI